MRHILPVAVLCCIVFFVVLPVIQAVSVTSAGIPSTIDQSADFTFDVMLSCKGCDGSYLRGVFYPSGISYFGFTQNKEGNWTNASGGNCTEYYLVGQSDLSLEGTWSGTLKVKPDMESPLYSGPGEYLFKVGRYTEKCGSPTWSQEVAISITGPTHTPTQTPSPTVTHTVTPNPTNTQIPTQTPTKTPTPGVSHATTPTVRQTQKITVSPTKKLSAVPTISDDGKIMTSISDMPESVLGVTSDTVVASVSAELTRKKILIITLSFIGSGLAVLTTALVYKTTLQKQSQGKQV
jgi:hypothetical protein